MHGLRFTAPGPWRAELDSCVSRTQLLRGMWGFPGSGIEHVSPALAGGFFITEPPGEPLNNSFLIECVMYVFFILTETLTLPCL